MDAIEMLTTRRSCRSYKPEQISRQELDTILECGLHAPSGSNKQLVKIVVVQDAEKIRFLSELNERILQHHADPFYGAPTLCLIVAPEDAGYDGNATSALNPVKDGSLVIGAMQDGAFALGIGSCWINRCKEMLELPEGKEFMHSLGLDGYMGIGCCILGYPDKAPGEKKIKEGRVVYAD